MTKKLKRIIILALVIIMILPTQMIKVLAVQIGDKADLHRGEKGFYTIQANMNGKWTYVTYDIVEYNDNGTKRIAYCVDPDLEGVGWGHGDVEGYSVDLTEILSDVRLWRVYRNGYPYATAEQLGVETDQDAYLATKQAAYWVIRNRPLNEIREHYRVGQTSIANQSLDEIQRRGEKVIDAIYNLAEKGINGTETPADSGIVSVNQIGELEQDSNSNYYSQKYEVTSTTEMSSYIVRNINGFPDGSYVSNLSGGSQTTFSSGEQFKVMIPKDKITESISGEVVVFSRCKTYPIFYGKSGDPKYQSYAVLVDPYGDIGASADTEIDVNKASIKIIKLDKDSRKPVDGVEFNFRYSDGENIGNYITNNVGEIFIDKLRPGTVIAKEVKTREEYILNDEEQVVTLGYEESKTITMENEHKRGNLYIEKIDKDDKTIQLGNIPFELYLVGNGEIKLYIDTYYTDVNRRNLYKRFVYRKLCTKRSEYK